MNNITITNLPILFVNNILSIQQKESLHIVFNIVEKIDNREENKTITEVCKELHENGIFIGNDTEKVYPNVQTIRNYYYYYRKKLEKE